MSSRLFLVVCEDCPPYEPSTVVDSSAAARRHTDRHATAVVDAVNQAAQFDDNMWCRRGEQSTPTGVDVRGVRVNGS